MRISRLKIHFETFGHEDSGTVRRLRTFLRFREGRLIPDEIIRMVREGRKQWIPFNQLDDTARQDVERSLRRRAAENLGLSYVHLQAASLLDAELGRDLLEDALKQRHRYRLVDRVGVLALAVRQGREGLVGEMFKMAEDVLNQTTAESGRVAVAKALAISEHPKALTLYLRLMEAAKQIEQTPNGKEYLSFEYQGLFAGLRRTHPQEYYSHLVGLLESKSYFERQFAAEQVGGLRMSFGYRAGDMAEKRERALVRLLPILRKVATLAPTQRRVFLLREKGVRLHGQPGKAWRVPLSKACADEDPQVVRLAVELIGDIVGSGGFVSVTSYPLEQRERIVRHMLADRLGPDWASQEPSSTSPQRPSK